MANYKDDINSLFDGLKTMLKSETIVGQSITVGDTIILPLIEITCGAGIGQFKGDSDAGGFGCKASPSAVLVIKNDYVKLINIKKQDAVTKLIDLMPDVLNKIAPKENVDEDVDEERLVAKKVKEIKKSYYQIKEKDENSENSDNNYTANIIVDDDNIEN